MEISVASPCIRRSLSAVIPGNADSVSCPDSLGLARRMPARQTAAGLSVTGPGRRHWENVDREATETSDAELLRRIASRDHAALGELYDRVSGVLFATAIHILGDRREAEEVLQDVFLQVWNKAETFNGTLGSAFNWTIGITRNRCIDYLRSRLRRSRLLDEALQEAGGDSHTSAATAGSRSAPRNWRRCAGRWKACRRTSTKPSRWRSSEA